MRTYLHLIHRDAELQSEHIYKNVTNHHTCFFHFGRNQTLQLDLAMFRYGLYVLLIVAHSQLVVALSRLEI